MKTTQQHKAYLTTANARKIVSQFEAIKKDSCNPEFHRILYKRPLFIFSTSELKELANFKRLIEKPEIFLDNFSKITPRKKSNDYIFSVNQPAYHNTITCNYIHSDFFNFLVPDVIKERGTVEIEKFVHWCEFNKPLFVKDRGAFEARVHAAFGVRLDEIFRENSGIQDFSIFDTPALEKKIDSILDEALEYYNKEKRYRLLLDEFAHKTWILHRENIAQYNTTEFDDVEFFSVLVHYKISFKDPVNQLLREYYKQKYNPDFSFDTFFLDQLGFRKCKHCYKEQ